jgi:hypothetical protein
MWIDRVLKARPYVRPDAGDESGEKAIAMKCSSASPCHPSTPSKLEAGFGSRCKGRYDSQIVRPARLS